MSFTTFGYVVFFLAVLAVSTAWPEHRRASKRVVLLGASYVFYASLDIRFLPVLVAVTVVTYVGALAIARSTGTRARKLALAVPVVLVLSFLAVFKYVPPLIESFEHALGALGLQPRTVVAEWLVPIGISFYTFSAVSYLVDVYRRKVDATADPLQVALYLAFFPQVLSGPIPRGTALMPQIAAMPRATESQRSEGLGLIVRGYAKKLLFADVLGLYFVTPAFAQTADQAGATLVLGLYAYTLQIYFDLSGYTDIARGSAKLLGLELAQNFNRPYLATSVSEFWTRWHISMSSFFREYLYFPLGGSKRGNVYFNLVVTFVAIGLWHGAGWDFLLYGFMHGGAVALERFGRTRGGSREASGASRLAGILYTFHFVVLTRLLFREDGLAGAGEYLVTLFSAPFWTDAVPSAPIAWAAFLVGAVLVFAPRDWQRPAYDRFRHAPAVVQAAGLLAFTYLLLAISPDDAPFVYFRF